MSPDSEDIDQTFNEIIDAEIEREDAAKSANRAAAILLGVGAASVVFFGLAVIGAVTVLRWIF